LISWTYIVFLLYFLANSPQFPARSVTNISVAFVIRRRASLEINLNSSSRAQTCLTLPIGNYINFLLIYNSSSSFASSPTYSPLTYAFNKLYCSRSARYVYFRRACSNSKVFFSCSDSSFHFSVTISRNPLFFIVLVWFAYSFWKLGSCFKCFIKRINAEDGFTGFLITWF
jgi:hypothetical protein